MYGLPLKGMIGEIVKRIGKTLKVFEDTNFKKTLLVRILIQEYVFV